MHEGKEDTNKHSAAVSTSTCSGPQPCQAPCSCVFPWPPRQCLRKDRQPLATSQRPRAHQTPKAVVLGSPVFHCLVVEPKFQTKNTTKSLASNLKLKIIFSFEHSLFLLSFHRCRQGPPSTGLVIPLKAVLCLHETLCCNSSLRNFPK